MNNRESEVLSEKYLKVYHAASAYIDMDYRKPLGQRDAVRSAVYADLVEKQRAGLSVTFITKNHRTYTDGIMKKVEDTYIGTEKAGMDQVTYWSVTITACIGAYVLARLFFLDIGSETPYMMEVTPRRLLTSIGLLVTLGLVSLMVRKGHSGKDRSLAAILLVVWVAMMFPLLPYLQKFATDTRIFSLNLSIVFVISLVLTLFLFGSRGRKSPVPRR
ncbi:MAG TPA: hypothetical protein VLN47_04130 [Clostridiaceae bacterium]|nr:hypothetical protein [Clostridiaceae bacterium]